MLILDHILNMICLSEFFSVRLYWKDTIARHVLHWHLAECCYWFSLSVKFSGFFLIGQLIDQMFPIWSHSRYCVSLFRLLYCILIALRINETSPFVSFPFSWVVRCTMCVTLSRTHQSYTHSLTHYTQRNKVKLFCHRDFFFLNSEFWTNFRIS